MPPLHVAALRNGVCNKRLINSLQPLQRQQQDSESNRLDSNDPNTPEFLVSLT